MNLAGYYFVFFSLKCILKYINPVGPSMIMDEEYFCLSRFLRCMSWTNCFLSFSFDLHAFNFRQKYQRECMQYNITKHGERKMSCNKSEDKPTHMQMHHRLVLYSLSLCSMSHRTSVKWNVHHANMQNSMSSNRWFVIYMSMKEGLLDWKPAQQIPLSGHHFLWLGISLPWETKLTTSSTMT